jgi:hypothetical protein
MGRRRHVVGFAGDLADEAGNKVPLGDLQHLQLGLGQVLLDTALLTVMPDAADVGAEASSGE